jgi:hypothetical protein
MSDTIRTVDGEFRRIMRYKDEKFTLIEPPAHKPDWLKEIETAAETDTTGYFLNAYREAGWHVIAERTASDNHDEIVYELLIIYKDGIYFSSVWNFTREIWACYFYHEDLPNYMAKFVLPISQCGDIQHHQLSDIMNKLNAVLEAMG